MRTFNPILLQIITRDSRRKKKIGGKEEREERREKKKLRDGFEATPVVIRTVAGP